MALAVERGRHLRSNHNHLHQCRYRPGHPDPDGHTHRQCAITASTSATNIAAPGRRAAPSLRHRSATRSAAFYQTQKRVREERELTEARAAHERNIERRRQAGWG
jgi:hypothetical protein